MATIRTSQTASPFLSPRQERTFDRVLRQANRQFRQGPNQFFPGQTFAGPSGATLSSLRQMARTARAGAPGIEAASQQGQQTLGGGFIGAGPGAAGLEATGRGDFLQPGTNPFLAATFNQSIAPAIRQNVNDQFLAGGRFGSAANTRALASELGNAATSFFGENFARERQNQMAAQQAQQNAFNAERARMMQAGAMAPSLFGAQFMPAQQLAAVGAEREAIAQQPINEAIQRFNFNQAAPAQNLAQLQAFAAGQPMGQTTQMVQPVNRNRFAGALGGGLAGGLLGGQFGGAGVLPGLALGALGGAFL